jgi:hypothetical protein
MEFEDKINLLLSLYFYGYPESGFLNPQFGTFLISFFWPLEFEGTSKYYEKLWAPFIVS